MPESEIIAGHHIEYSGMKFALFFLGEYVHAFAVSCIIVTLFLGGWRGPNLFGLTVPWLWFFVKAILVFDVMVLGARDAAALRIDHLMAFNWKFLVPLSLANTIVVALADRLAQALGLAMGTWPWALMLLAFNLALIFAALALVGSAGRRARRAAESPALRGRIAARVGAWRCVGARRRACAGDGWGALTDPSAGREPAEGKWSLV